MNGSWPARILFSCTTFLDFKKRDRWAAFCETMDSILRHHPPAVLNRISRWLIVNEWAADGANDWAERVTQRYPFVTFIQKGARQKGQAASMNLILEEVPLYTYWIHWEETWPCKRSCLDRMIDVIQYSSISQLQVTRHKGVVNWTDSKNSLLERTTPSEMRTRYIEIRPTAEVLASTTKSVWDFNDSYFSSWPLYSLLPSINRVSAIGVGPFNTDPRLWPIKFEWEYGRRWLAAGGTKAVLPDGPAERDETGHSSTYD